MELIWFGNLMQNLKTIRSHQLKRKFSECVSLDEAGVLHVSKWGIHKHRSCQSRNELKKIQRTTKTKQHENNKKIETLYYNPQ